MKTIPEILTAPDRDWDKKPGASEEEIQTLLDGTGISFPEKYVELLRFSNGGYGELGLPPLLLILSTTQMVLQDYHLGFYQEEFQGFIFIGGNGGMEKIAFDTRAGMPWSIVMIDPIAGPESAVKIADDICAFIDAIGVKDWEQGSDEL